MRVSDFLTKTTNRHIKVNPRKVVKISNKQKKGVTFCGYACTSDEKKQGNRKYITEENTCSTKITKIVTHSTHTHIDLIGTSFAQYDTEKNENKK